MTMSVMVRVMVMMRKILKRTILIREIPNTLSLVFETFLTTLKITK